MNAPQAQVAQAAPVSILQMDHATAFLRLRGTLNAADLREKYEATRAFAIPVVSKKIVEILVNGVRIKRRETLEDINPQFAYLYLTAEAMQTPTFDNYVPVMETNDFGKGCPKKSFGPDGFIRQGEAVLCATSRPFWKAQREDPKNMMGKRVQGFSAGKELKRDDSSDSTVKNETFAVETKEPDEFAADNGYEA